MIGMALGVALCVTTNTLNWHWQQSYNAVAIEYLKVLLTFPTVLLILVFLFFIKFSSAIDFLIRNLRVRYGEVEASASQRESKEYGKGYGETIQLSTQDAQAIAASIKDAEQLNIDQTDEISKLKEIISSLANRAEVYEFAFLNYFLVPNTKASLKGLHGDNTITKNDFLSRIPSNPTSTDQLAEKNAIYSALIENDLIKYDSGMVSVTDKGRRYLKVNNLI